MSALAHRLPHHLPRHHQLPKQYEMPAPRRHLTLVPEPRRISSRVYRRRRMVVAAGVTLVLLAAGWSLHAGLTWVADRASAPVAAVPVSQPMAQQWTVRPGDTLWGIARAVQPQGDIRPLLGKLTAAYKGHALQVGETIAIPG